MQTSRLLPVLLAVGTGLLFAAPPGLDAQVLDRIRRTAEQAALARLDALVRDGVGCLFNDLECIRQAQEGDKDVYLTDADGNPIVDEDGNPVTDPAAAAAILGEETPAAMLRPGEGVWARYDFVPGDDVLFVEDFRSDAVGDFPRRFELIRGSWEVVEWQGGRYLRALAGGTIALPLPETLPDRFTLETVVNLKHGNAWLNIMPVDESLTDPRDYEGSVVSTQWRSTGIEASGAGPDSRTRHDQAVWDAMVPLRVMADGDYVKVYLGENRMANVPNAVLPRTNRIAISLGSASEASPIMIGPIRIAAGGADLYDRLAADGRVATQGILFDVDSDRIRPESTPTLKAIGEMLEQHADLRLSIEGHTDSDGEDTHNLDLSVRRAAAVRTFLIDTYGVDADRLESTGFGESTPAAPNTTLEGKQQNRRVELVRLGGD